MNSFLEKQFYIWQLFTIIIDATSDITPTQKAKTRGIFLQRHSQTLKYFFFWGIKRQIMSKFICEINNFPKYQKNLIDFCPGRSYRLGTCGLLWLFSEWLYSGRNISFFCGILENRWCHKLILTSSDLYHCSS